ncbi:hypothetical protein QVD17_28151 [Tagetes erecta]|uniref:Methyltransferase type 11 domain-containing protein n=1 Tax=Tagetes erecta TaxID=13708 RepID=A0AAD8NRY8_TARER|nr:hypothetical protein QVD17_28151 [Tagetes erecta]
MQLGLLAHNAAAEAEAATMSMVRWAIPDASSLEEANEIVICTKFLADKFPSAKLTGLDLSSYFLAVAKYKEKRRPKSSNSFQWIHANGEDTSLDSQSFDIVSTSYVLHECPARATINLTKQAFRLLQLGGTFVVTDNSPKSKKLQIERLNKVIDELVKEKDEEKERMNGVIERLAAKNETMRNRMENFERMLKVMARGGQSSS